MTHRDIIEKVANKYDIDPEAVEDLVDYMWHLVTRCFNDNRLPNVRLYEVGLFSVSPLKLKRLLNKMDSPDYKYKNKKNFEEYKKNMQEVYKRRLKEEYFGNSKKIPSALKSDVEKFKKLWN